MALFLKFFNLGLHKKPLISSSDVATPLCNGHTIFSRPLFWSIGFCLQLAKMESMEVDENDPQL